jgi:hypothetical protein
MRSVMLFLLLIGRVSVVVNEVMGGVVGGQRGDAEGPQALVSPAQQLPGTQRQQL